MQMGDFPNRESALKCGGGRAASSTCIILHSMLICVTKNEEGKSVNDMDKIMEILEKKPFSEAITVENTV